LLGDQFHERFDQFSEEQNTTARSEKKLVGKSQKSPHLRIWRIQQQKGILGDIFNFTV
jgi:hypothetical protein